jgi:hypothetical protein
VVVLEPGDVNVVAIVRVLSPAKVDVHRIRVVEFVVVLDRPLDIETTGVGTAETVVEAYFECGGIEKIV